MRIPTPAERARTILRLAPCLRVRTPVYVDVVEALVGDGGADPDDVGMVTFLDPAECAAARPDPLAGTEAALLGHLVAGRPTELRRLAAQLPEPGCDGAVPVALDRYGLVLRCGAGDVRLRFGTPVHCPDELPARMRELLGRGPAAVPGR